MRKGLLFGFGSLALLVTMLLLYPVGGVIWRSDQVHRLAQIAGERRSETDSPAAIREALAAARSGRIRLIFKALRGEECPPRDLEFLTDAGWVPVRIHCPGGFFLDYLPHP